MNPPPKKLKFPKLSKKKLAEIRDAIPAHMAKMRQDESDRRCLRGAYAPATGVCRVCSGKVVGQVRFRHSDRIGGPPPGAYVAHWACEDCGLMYEKTPPPKESP